MSLLLAAVLPLVQVSSIPAYKLEPGAELVYQVETELHYGRKPMTRKGKISLLVLGKDEEKGLLLGVVDHEGGGRTPRLGLLWLSPKGTFRLHDLTARAWWGGCPMELFPPLPAGGKGPWKGGKDIFGKSLVVTGAEKGEEGLVLAFRFRFSEPEEKVYGWKGGGKAWFDPKEGCVTKVVYERGSDRYPRSTRAKVTLQERKAHSPEWASSQRSAIEAFLQGQAKFYSLGSWLPRDEKEVAAKVKEMKAFFEKIAKGHEGAAAGKAARGFLSRIEPSLKRRLDEAKRFRGILGRKAPDLVLPDLEGKKHAFADFRGKVVVLDFWYRGCGWCIRSMPMVMDAFSRLSGKPVLFFGMNVDKKLEDALFVEKTMKPPYPSLRTDKDTAKKFGVRGYPTFVILDKEGRIADFKVGWAADLSDILVKKVTRLLE